MKKILMAFAAALILLFSGCAHKELCYLHPHLTRLRVVYDWQNSPDASPAGMRVFFYPESDPGTYYYFDFSGTEGGYVEVPSGAYRVISYNNDTQTSQFGAINSFDAHHCFTREGNILEPIYGNGMGLPNRGDDAERVVICPDDLYLCQAMNVTVNETEADQVITLYPRDVLCHYTYEVRNVRNIEHIHQISGAISGMAPGLSLSDEILHTEPVTLPFAASTGLNRARENGATGTVTGSFLTFGHHEDNAMPHRMSFYVVMKDGSKYQFTEGDKLDVTDQVHSAPNRRRVHIIIDGLDIPDPISGDNGAFLPEIDNWGIIESDIII